MATCGLVTISLALTLSGCGSSTATGTAATSSGSTTAARSQLTVENAWVKTADSGMTAVFGEIRNTSGSTMTVISVTTSASPEAGLHEMAMVGGTKQMRSKKGGFVIPAGTTYLLAPGGDHIMVMAMTKPVRPGDTVDVTLSLADGSTTAFAALAKASSGGAETYAPGHSPMPSSVPAK
jgi:copper(I)-binding protein